MKKEIHEAIEIIRKDKAILEEDIRHYINTKINIFQEEHDLRISDIEIDIVDLSNLEESRGSVYDVIKLEKLI